MKTVITKHFARKTIRYVAPKQKHKQFSSFDLGKMTVLYLLNPFKVPKRHFVPPTRSSLNEFAKIVEVDSYFISKFILLFCMFYGSINYFYYRSLRKDDDDE